MPHNTRKYGLRTQQLTVWRWAARSGRLALISDDPAEFLPIEIRDAMARHEPDARIEISIGKVVRRLKGDTASSRVAEIVAALERRS